jgi:hypothetical protein
MATRLLARRNEALTAASVACVCMMALSAGAQQPAAPGAPPADVRSRARRVRVSAPADNPWQFEDDETPVETWRDILRGQAADLVLFAAFVALALVSFFRKSVRLKQVTLIAAVVYLGFYKSQLLSIVNVFGVLGANLPIFKYNLGWYAFAGFSAVSTVLWGRLYCGRICAYGAMTQLLDPIVPATVPLRCTAADRAPRGQDQVRAARRRAPVFPDHQGHHHLPVRRAVLDVHAPRSTGMWIGLGVLLLATVFVRNLYCRFLCPLGARWGCCRS